MYESIDETISVIGVYANAHFVPKKFLWNEREYVISTVTFAADIKEGDIRKRHYTVISEGNAYRLLFDRSKETWKLKEVWNE
jgi:hypothetical protein